MKCFHASPDLGAGVPLLAENTVWGAPVGVRMRERAQCYMKQNILVEHWRCAVQVLGGSFPLLRNNWIGGSAHAVALNNSSAALQGNGLHWVGQCAARFEGGGELLMTSNCISLLPSAHAAAEIWPFVGNRQQARFSSTERSPSPRFTSRKHHAKLTWIE